jgi:hypothetical protein
VGENHTVALVPLEICYVTVSKKVHRLAGFSANRRWLPANGGIFNSFHARRPGAAENTVDFRKFSRLPSAGAGLRYTVPTDRNLTTKES